MKYEFLWVYIFIVITSLCHASKQIERFAIIAGVNNGGQNRQVLKYAVDDAVDFSNVMFDMGGLSPKNTILLKEPSITEFNNALNNVFDLMKAGDKAFRRELIVYYSGHADENGLFFGNQCFDYRKLRMAIDSIGSDVKITILDACASGSITRIKGGIRKKAFLVDASSDLTGYAFITSSLEQEVSQESDKIKGSFFTHFLVSGLRGAADMSSDGKVTLSEAYQFAFNETLTGTESTINGPQHPSYDMRLTGSGDVVMTDIRSVNAVVKFPTELSGRIFIRNSDNKLIAELVKQKGKVIEIGIPDGEITVQLSTSEGNLGGKFKVFNDTVIIVSLDRLKKQSQEKTPYQKKGIDLQNDRDHRFICGISVDDSLVLRGVSLSLLSNITHDTLRGIQHSLFSNKTYKPLVGLQCSRFVSNYCKESVTGMQKALISNKTESTLSGMQLAVIHNSAWKRVKGMQLSAGVNSCYDTLCGVQSGLISITDKFFCGLSVNLISTICSGKTWGVQLGCINFSHSIEGVQISPVINMSSTGGVKGVQIAGVLNTSNGSVHGVQFGPLLNVAREVNGVQLGLINCADTVKGVQAGLINISDDMYGYPVGLFNYSKKGVFALCIWTDEQGLTNFTLQSGTRHFYNSFTAAIAKNGTKAAGFGMGYRIPLKYIVIENDMNHYFTFRHLNSEKEMYDITEKVRLSIGTRFIPLVSISAGASYNCLFNFDRNQNVNLSSVSKRNLNRLEQGIYTWPGFHIGISFGRF